MIIYGRVAFNKIANRNFFMRTFNSQVPNVKDMQRFIRIQKFMRLQCELISIIVLSINISSLIANVTESVFTVRFSS
jgi:hypothetical protein